MTQGNQTLMEFLLQFTDQATLKKQLYGLAAKMYQEGGSCRRVVGLE